MDSGVPVYIGPVRSTRTVWFMQPEAENKEVAK